MPALEVRRPIRLANPKTLEQLRKTDVKKPTQVRYVDIDDFGEQNYKKRPLEVNGKNGNGHGKQQSNGRFKRPRTSITNGSSSSQAEKVSRGGPHLNGMPNGKHQTTSVSSEICEQRKNLPIANGAFPTLHSCIDS